MPNNPYESPHTEANAANPLAGRVFTENMLYYLRGAAPWLRFIGIVGFILLGITVIAFLAIMTWFGNDLDSIGMGMFAPVMFVVYFPGLAVWFFLTLFTYRFGKKTQVYCRTGDHNDLEAALKSNKSLWTLTGALCIIGLVVFAFMLIIGIIAVTAAVTHLR